MPHEHVFPSAVALAFVAVALGGISPSPALAAPQDYRFELVGKPQLLAKKDVVQVRLMRIVDGRSVPDAVIFESTADMGPAGMETMTAPVKALPPKAGTYSFSVEPGMAGVWALHLAAKVQGEQETIRGTVNADLVK